MFDPTAAFSGFSVDDLDKAKTFYTETLGLVTESEFAENGEAMGLKLVLPGGATVFVYPKSDHQPATFTILNFSVDTIDEAVNSLTEKGVQFEHYPSDDLPQDEKGVLRGLSAGMGPDIAWFRDPAGNILSVLQEK